MALALVVGPAKAGKIARLLAAYLDAIERDPVLIVPNAADVERVERDLLRRSGALLSGSIGTFDDLFRELVRGAADVRPVAGEAQQTMLVRRALARTTLNGLGRSAQFGGFADALLAVLRELESGLLDPAQLDGDLAVLYAAYRAELDELGLWDRDVLRRRAVERLGSELEAWDGRPVFAYGFEDLTGVEWALLENLAGRAEVTVSLPYEPGRPAFASLQRTVEDLAALAGGRIEELPARSGEYGHPAIAHVERFLFADEPPPGPELAGAIRFFEGAGARGVLELVSEEIRELAAAGTPLHEIALVVPSLERWRAPVETVLGTLEIPFAVEGRVRLGQTPFGHSLLALLRFAWQGGGRRDLYAFLRSPFSGFGRANVDFLEGRLRGRAVSEGALVEDETNRLRDGQPIPALEALRSATGPVAGVRRLARAMARAAYGLEAPPVTLAAQRDLRAYDAVARLLDELEGWIAVGGELSPDETLAALERSEVRLERVAETGRVAILDLSRARTRRFDSVFVLGLEEGSLPRRGRASPFLDDEVRSELDGWTRARLTRPDPVSRDRYLFYTACTRATRRLTLVREAATDEGSPREASPFWDELAGLFEPGDVARWTRRRSLSQLTWSLEAAPSERERLRALAQLAAGEPSEAESLAAANGWERRLDRARRAFTRSTRLTHPRVLGELSAKSTFNVTELERFADCSSAWFFERLIDPHTIDRRVDAMLRGSVAHTTLHRFYAGLPKEVGSDRVEESRLDRSLEFLGECLDGALGGVRMEMTELERRELEQSLRRDLEQLVRDEAKLELPLLPRRFEVSFGSDRSAPELQRGLDLGDGISLSGKIDRIDVDPGSARGIVQDYKSGRTGHSAVEIEKELRLQIPLYMLVLRDLVGIEPLGGLYRPLAGERRARGLLRLEAKDDGIPGFAKHDYLDEDAFWDRVEGARELARGFAQRIQAGDVLHDPKGGECPAWCDLWRMCRIRRA
ncbi:MAG: PD-(D/E)XK nuclease family protein [Gaiellaceae bacterium MAG52_C11]|nr:PD-(D/E)XK nuclease family protein [Candidatus Gaiellasilicea maunaloa]